MKKIMMPYLISSLRQKIVKFKNLWLQYEHPHVFQMRILCYAVGFPAYAEGFTEKKNIIIARHGV